MIILIVRAIELQLLERDFLKTKSDAQSISQVAVSAYRGKIVDRSGAPLAISTPVSSVWINPQRFQATADQRRQLVELLGLTDQQLNRLTESENRRRFVYLKRRINPHIADQVRSLAIKGLSLEREFRRYYPTGEVTAHLIGFTDIDDRGQAGLERTYNQQMAGTAGRKRVIRDGSRRAIEEREYLRQPVAGRELTLSIDQRLQYLAYRELKAAVERHQALGGSLVMLDARSGEVLAMVNQPSFNPNGRKNLTSHFFRNRAVIDLFEPGSTVKPFAVACALNAGTVQPNQQFETAPGEWKIGNNRVRDTHNYGRLDVAHVLLKSSNIGVSKIALTLTPKQLLACYRSYGFGHSAEIGFPAEAEGTLPKKKRINQFEQATLSFGYGLAVTTLQLARAYAALANDGLLRQVTLLNDEKHQSAKAVERVMSTETAQTVRQMLVGVVSQQGTASRAAVTGYSVAGKTGTVKKLTEKGYSSDRYLAIFAGMVPANRPRIVLVVMVDEPSTNGYYGGLVAAPVFSRVIKESVRLLGIAPDRANELSNAE